VKIGIYNESGLGSWGGSEYAVIRLAADLARAHDVELIHHLPSLTRTSLAATSGENLDAIALRYVPREPNPFQPLNPSWRTLRQSRHWYRSLSEPYDTFINSTHGMPPFCHARRGVLLVLFPMFKAFETWPWKSGPHDTSGPIRKRLRRYCYDWEWRRRFDTYQVKVANSHYTRRWTKKWWGIDCDVVYPPVDCRFSVVEKRNTIVSVGRFIAKGVVKNQLELMRAFRDLDEILPADSEYRCIGGLGSGEEDQRYVDSVRRVAESGHGRAHVLTNVSRSELISTYERAKVFWHATGYGQDLDASPYLAEHFGIVTVEAMAAGCVPVVINCGGQPEIVQHGVNGFLWNTLDELKAYTVRLLSDEQLAARMGHQARERASIFADKVFTERFESIVKGLA
jgi:glycosyltransferase involved in cell wall biosynthesis